MPARRKRKMTSVPLVNGNDPSLWRFSSLSHALENHSLGLVQLIQEGKRLEEVEKQKQEFTQSA